MAWRLRLPCRRAVAIPLGQGQVFNALLDEEMAASLVAIPLDQGQVFNGQAKTDRLNFRQSQSLWVRDRFLIGSKRPSCCRPYVAIPLGQGQVFNHRNEHDGAKNMSSNPFGSGTGF